MQAIIINGIINILILATIFIFVLLALKMFLRAKGGESLVRDMIDNDTLIVVGLFTLGLYMLIKGQTGTVFGVVLGAFATHIKGLKSKKDSSVNGNGSGGNGSGAESITLNNEEEAHG